MTKFRAYGHRSCLDPAYSPMRHWRSFLGRWRVVFLAMGCRRVDDPEAIMQAAAFFEIDRIESAERDALQHRLDYERGWRDLKRRRDGIAQQLARKVATFRAQNLGTREEDPATIYAAMLASLQAAVSKALRDARSAKSALARHESAVLARVAPGWWSEVRQLRSAAEELENSHVALEASLRNQKECLRRRAAVVARENACLNARDNKPLEPWQDRLAGLDIALRAVERGNDSAVACLMRGNIEELIEVAKIWDRMERGEKVSDVSYSRYVRAAGDDPAHSPFASLFAALADRAAQPRSRDTVIDGVWSPVTPGRPRGRLSFDPEGERGESVR